MQGSYLYDQTITREEWLIPIYENLVKYALRAGALAPLQYSLLEKYQAHYWQGYRKNWVDPLSKTKSDALEEQMGYKSKKQNITERGNRMEEVIADKVELKKLEEKNGVEIEAPQKTNTADVNPAAETTPNNQTIDNNTTREDQNTLRLIQRG